MKGKLLPVGRVLCNKNLKHVPLTWGGGGRWRKGGCRKIPAKSYWRLEKDPGYVIVERSANYYLKRFLEARNVLNYLVGVDKISRQNVESINFIF